MLETLEELDHRFKRIWRQKVPMQELTVLAFHPSPQKALVLTNKSLYLLEKKLLSVSFNSWDRKTIRSVRVKDLGILLEVGQKKLQIDFSQDKLSLRQAVLEKLEEEIKKSR